MQLEEAVFAGAIVALLGAIHCVAMCGGLAVLAARSTAGRLPYLIGKSLTYGLLGALAGGLGGALTTLAPMQRGLSIAAGVILALSGLAWLGGLTGFGGGWPKGLDALSRVSSSFSQIAGRILSSRHVLKSAAFGIANGFFPCGLVYAALALALATSSVAGGAVVMVVFGLATAPALLTSAWVFDRMQPSLRSRWQSFGGFALVVLGVVTVFRASLLHMH